MKSTTERLESVLFQQIEEAGWNLRRHNRCPGNFRLEIRYADGVSADTRRRIFPGSVQADRLLFRSILPVFYQLFRRRVAVRRLVLEFSDLRDALLLNFQFSRGKKRPRQKTATFRKFWIRSA